MKEKKLIVDKFGLGLLCLYMGMVLIVVGFLSGGTYIGMVVACAIILIMNATNFGKRE